MVCRLRQGVSVPDETHIGQKEASNNPPFLYGLTQDINGLRRHKGCLNLIQKVLGGLGIQQSHRLEVLGCSPPGEIGGIGLYTVKKQGGQLFRDLKPQLCQVFC